MVKNIFPQVNSSVIQFKVLINVLRLINDSGGNLADLKEDIFEHIEKLIHTARKKRNSNTKLSVNELENLLGFPQKKLFTYGSLQPGSNNYYLLSNLGGTWVEGYVNGKYINHGWGVNDGYKAMIWDENEGPIHGHLLISGELIEHWPKLDDFEGSEYKKILVPFIYQNEVIIAYTYSGNI